MWVLRTKTRFRQLPRKLQPSHLPRSLATAVLGPLLQKLSWSLVLEILVCFHFYELHISSSISKWCFSGMSCLYCIRYKFSFPALVLSKIRSYLDLKPLVDLGPWNVVTLLSHQPLKSVISTWRHQQKPLSHSSSSFVYRRLGRHSSDGIFLTFRVQDPLTSSVCLHV